MFPYNVNRCKECQDGTSETPTCGFAYHTNGTAMALSQGFCCRCSFTQVFSNGEITRGSLDCNPFGYKMASAHCLRFGDNWWDLFDIGLGQLFYEIEIDIKGEKFEETIKVSPSQNVAINKDKSVLATIVGDFNPWTQYPTFESQFLAIPSKPAGSSRVLAGVANWMTVSKDNVDISGMSCNKIGIGYTGFYSQQTRCNVPAGYCLHNQLDDIFNVEEKLRIDKKPVHHLISRHGDIVNMSNQTRYTFGIQFSSTQNTLMTLNIKADTMKYIQFVSAGRILEASIEDFESFTREGKLNVKTGNTGQVISKYELQVVNCSQGILPIVSKSFDMMPNELISTTFNLYAQTVFGQENSCNVRLLSAATANLLDEVIVHFNTTDKDDRNNQNGTTEIPPGGEAVDGVDTSCSVICPTFFDVPCFVVKGCWGQFFLFLFVLLIVIGIVVLCVKTRCLKCCCCCCRSSKKKSKSKSEDGEEEEPKKKKKKERNDEEEYKPPKPKKSKGKEEAKIKKPAKEVSYKKTKTVDVEEEQTPPKKKAPEPEKKIIKKHNTSPLPPQKASSIKVWNSEDMSSVASESYDIDDIPEPKELSVDAISFSIGDSED